MILGVDGYSDFNALHSGKHNEEVQLCAFDVLAMDDDDSRDLPLSIEIKPALIRPTPRALLDWCIAGWEINKLQGDGGMFNFPTRP